MKTIKNWLISILIFIVVLVAAIVGANLLLPKSPNYIKPKVSEVTKKPQIKLLALGDSLTEGVGDETKQGGYVSLLKKDIESNYDVPVKTKNAGISGNTSTQILNRVRTQNSLQNEIKNADAITLTVGGNDFMHSFYSKQTKTSQKDLNKSRQSYQKNLQKLIATVRKYNRNAPIFLVGIYNPLYNYYQTNSTWQKNINEWNLTNKRVAESHRRTYFVDINSEMSKGKGLTTTSTSTKTSNSTTNKNALISTDDHFHPNSKGYQVMADQLMAAVKKHQKLKKTTNLTAIGDSLTYGTGDETKNQGYVGAFTTDEKKQKKITIKSQDFGVPGNTSPQILKRIGTPEIQNSLKSADMVTLTAGGNDFMAVVQKSATNLDEKKLDAGKETYAQDLSKIISSIQSANSTAPIYVFSLYNPYRAYFPDFKVAQTSIDSWNKTIKSVTKNYQHVYFVDINKSLSNGKAKKADTKPKTANKNKLISTADHVHPNHAGYQVIDHNIFNQMKAKQETWLVKD